MVESDSDNAVKAILSSRNKSMEEIVIQDIRFFFLIMAVVRVILFLVREIKWLTHVPNLLFLLLSIVSDWRKLLHVFWLI